MINSYYRSDPVYANNNLPHALQLTVYYLSRILNARRIRFTSFQIYVDFRVWQNVQQDYRNNNLDSNKFLEYWEY